MKQFFTILFAVLSVFILHGQETPFHYFNTAGVQNEAVYCVQQDAEGRLLLGTQRGLLRYNGFTTKRIPTADESSREIKQIFATSKGVFVINNHGELFQMKNDTLKRFTVEGLNTDIRWVETEGDYLKLTTARELVVVHVKKKTISERTPFLFAEDPKTYVRAFSRDQEHYHVTSEGELVLATEGEARSIPFLSSDVEFCASINGSILLATRHYSTGGLISYSNGQFRKVPLISEHKRRHIYQVKVIHDQTMIFTNDGVVVYANGLKKTPTVWFSGISCYDAFEDPTGNCWIATKNRGLILIPSGRHHKITNESVSAISFDDRGELVLGAGSSSIVRMKTNGTSLQRVTSEGLIDEVSFCHYDNVFGGYFYSSGFVSASGELTHLGKRIHAVCRTPNGELLLATSKGLFRYPNVGYAIWKKRSKNPAFGELVLEGNCHLMVRGEKDGIVVANADGLFVVENGEVKEIRKGNDNIRATHATWFQSSLYVVTTGNALLEIKGNRVIHTRYLNQTEVINVLKLSASSKHLYLLTENGLYRAPKMDAKFESLKDALGFDGVFIRDFCVKNDQVFLATQEGVFNYDWTTVKKLAIHFVVGQPQNKNKKETARRSFKSGNLTLPVECIDLTGAHAFHLQYRLVYEGTNGDWVEVVPGTERIPFPSLASGKYTVELRMIDPVSGSSTEVQKRHFEIQSNWYELKLLWMSIGVALVLGIQWVMKKLRPEKPKRIRKPKPKVA